MEFKEFKKETEELRAKQEREIAELRQELTVKQEKENERLRQELKRLETIFNNHSKGTAMIHGNYRIYPILLGHFSSVYS